DDVAERNADREADQPEDPVVPRGGHSRGEDEHRDVGEERDGEEEGQISAPDREAPRQGGADGEGLAGGNSGDGDGRGWAHGENDGAVACKQASSRRCTSIPRKGRGSEL